MSFHRLFVGAALAASLLASASASAQSLGSYKVDLTQTSVSGLSSGAFMAVQYHIAHSSSLIGAAVVAGGPDFCAEGNAAIAMGCMKIMPMASSMTAANLFWQAQSQATLGQIDPMSSLTSSKVYLFSGTNDTVVSTGTVDAVQSFYNMAGVTGITYDNSVPAGHAFLSPQGPGACGVSATPYVNKCTVNGTVYDQPYQVLNTLYGNLQPASATNGSAIAFDQTQFGPSSNGLASTGYVYVPAACQGSQAVTCKVHVVFHGCLQSAQSPGIGDIVYNQVGYNRWAETNNLIVLYPQVATNNSKNPQTCWDWFGYTNGLASSPTQYATSSGPQIQAVNAMIQRLAGK